MTLTKRQEELLNTYLDGHRVKTIIEKGVEQYYLVEVVNHLYTDVRISTEDKLFMDTLAEQMMNPTKAEEVFDSYEYIRV